MTCRGRYDIITICRISRGRNEFRSKNLLLLFTMAALRFLLLVCTILVPNNGVVAYYHSLEEKEIEVTTNPYAGENAVCSSVQNLLSPHLLMVEVLPTQPDTFLNVRHAKVFTQPVPVYKMQQPARLNPGQFQFDMVLVRELASHTNVYEIPVADPQKALDSWFPGFSWTPIVHHCGDTRSGDDGGGDYQHVGWKFASTNGETFYALLVQVDERRKKNSIAVGGFKAAEWMLRGITI